MSKNAIVTIVVIIVLVVLGFFFFSKKSAVAPTTETQTETPTSPTGGTNQTPTVKQTVITFTDSGFSPSTVTIKAGEMVIFKNTSTHDMWPASAMHPTHTVYPGSDIKKCGTAAASTIFDACRAIAPGASYSFTFTEVGSWNYHDHLNSRFFGKIVVQ